VSLNQPGYFTVVGLISPAESINGIYKKTLENDMKRVVIEIRPCMMANRNSLIRLSNKVDDTGSELKYIYAIWLYGSFILLYYIEIWIFLPRGSVDSLRECVSWVLILGKTKNPATDFVRLYLSSYRNSTFEIPLRFE
jgi:hypothetical protein